MYTDDCAGKIEVNSEVANTFSQSNKPTCAPEITDRTRQLNSQKIYWQTHTQVRQQHEQQAEIKTEPPEVPQKAFVCVANTLGPFFMSFY